MKKVITMMLALVLVCMSFAVFAEEDKTLYPEHGLNMETFDQSEDFTVSASLSSASVTDQTVILDIYDDDLYSVEALRLCSSTILSSSTMRW